MNQKRMIRSFNFCGIYIFIFLVLIFQLLNNPIYYSLTSSEIPTYHTDHIYHAYHASLESSDSIPKSMEIESPEVNVNNITTYIHHLEPSSAVSTSRAQSASRTNSINLIINKNQIREFTGNRTVNNITIRDDGTLIIKDSIFWINGTLKIIDNGRLFIMNSTVHIAPGPVGPQVIIINFSDNAHVQISDSYIYTHPQPTLTNISYLLSDHNTEVTILRSFLDIRLPAIVNMDIELTPPNAGTFILTGETIWNINNCSIEGYLFFNIIDIIDENGNVTKQKELVSRWFLFTLQRKAKLFMKDTIGSMENDRTQPFIKPVAGYTKLERCTIRSGTIDVEVIGELEAIELTIYNLNLRDQSKSKVVKSKIENNLDVGSPAIFSPTGEGEDPRAFLYMEDTIIGTEPANEGLLIASGNSSSTLSGVKLKKCSLHKTSVVNFVNSEIEQIADLKDKSSLILEETEISKILLNDQSQLNILSIPSGTKIRTITTTYNCRSKINLHEVNLETFEVWPGDGIPPTEYGNWYEPDKNVSKVSVSMINSTLNKLLSSDDAHISLILQKSTISKIDFDKYKNEHVQISILDLDSTYTIPEPWPDIDLDIEILHKISIQTFVNDKPVRTNIVVNDKNNVEIYNNWTSDSGTRELELFYEQYTKTGIISAGEYSMSFSYLGFSKAITTNAKIGDSYSVSWEDKSPPVIDNIEIDQKYQRTERGTIIQATISDSDVKLVANATIHYQTRDESGWSKWKGQPMVEIENNIFEGIIDSNTPGTKVRFYIESYDILGNRIKSEKQSYEISDTRPITIISLVAIFIVIIFLIIFFILIHRKKINIYLNKPKTPISK